MLEIVGLYCDGEQQQSYFGLKELNDQYVEILVPFVNCFIWLKIDRRKLIRWLFLLQIGMRLIAEEDKLVAVKKETDKREFSMADQNLFIGMYRDTIYKNKLRVIPQEYMANARDAHREVGKDHIPIEVTLPSIIDPMLVIRDFGPGINEDRSIIFSQYGASTKRECDSQNGGFGIGCKCAWSYTESFTIDTVYEEDGKKINRIYSLYITHSLDPGNIRIVSETEMDHDTPTGTKICIPIMSNDIDSVIKSVATAAAFWDVQPRIVDNKGKVDTEFEFANTTTKTNFSGDLWKHYNYTDLFGIGPKESFAVVDGICYKLDFEILTRGKSQYEETEDDEVEEIFYGVEGEDAKVLKSNSIALFFDVNEVVVAPDRENLDYNVRTIKAISELAKKAVSEIINKFREFVIKPNSSYYDILCAANALDLNTNIDVVWTNPRSGSEINVFKAARNLNQANCTIVDSDGIIVNHKGFPWKEINAEKTAFLLYDKLSGLKSAANRLSEVPESIKDQMNAEKVVFFTSSGYRRVSKTNIRPLITHRRIKTNRGTNRDTTVCGIYDSNDCELCSLNQIEPNALFLIRRHNVCYIDDPNYRNSVRASTIQRYFPNHNIYSISTIGEKVLKKAGIKVQYASKFMKSMVVKKARDLKDHLYYENIHINSRIIDFVDNYGDLVKEWAELEGRRTVLLAFRTIERIRAIKENTNAGPSLRMLDFTSMCNRYDLKFDTFPEKYCELAERIIEDIPFFRIRIDRRYQIIRTADRRYQIRNSNQMAEANKIMSNIIKTYKEIF